LLNDVRKKLNYIANLPTYIMCQGTNC